MIRRSDAKPEREVSSWLDNKGIPLQRYQNLEKHERVVLQNLLCIPTRSTSPTQRKDLYKKLCLLDIAGKGSVDPSDFVPDDKIEEFFTPIAPSKTLTDREMY